MGRPLVEAHPELKWDDRLSEIGGTRVSVLADDTSDGTSKVRSRFQCWLPTESLISYSVRVAPKEVLQPALEEHPTLQWEERREAMCGEEGVVVTVDDQDETAKVSF